MSAPRAQQQAQPLDLAAPIRRASSFFAAPIGKKVVMAVTGVIWFGYVIGHLLGNLQIYVGAEQINSYARTLHELPLLLWGTRIVLSASIVLHVGAAIQLARGHRAARPIGYGRWRGVGSTYASRTMIISGPLLAAFIVYHLLHLTVGTAHPSFVELDAYGNLVRGLSDPVVAAAYIVAMLFLGLHLHHGIWSMFQSVGVNHPRYTPWLRNVSAALAWAIVLGNVSIPISIWTGVLGGG